MSQYDEAKTIDFDLHPMCHRYRIPLTLGYVVAIALLSSLFTQPTYGKPLSSTSPPIFENITLSPNFTPDPLTVRGLSGGSVLAEKTTGRAKTPTGLCIGFIDEQPDHTLVLRDFFNYLSLRVKSNADTILVIKGPGGSWCSDNNEGINPGITGQWLSGTYQIWVGSYQSDGYHPYIINITDDP
ncbi:MAG: hypothetical protein WBA77_21570 [Microcoleaceae cyanobacterium]